jgi:hypothetical protein
MIGASGGDVVLEVSPAVQPTGRAALTEAEDQKLHQLFKKAQSGDQKALDEIRPILDKASLWEFMGDLTRRVQQSWLEAMTGPNALIREAYERRAVDMRRELLAQGDSQVERLLVERVIITWLQVCHADTLYAVALKGEGHSFREGTYHQQRQDRANTRHLKALNALTTARKLPVPAVQINVGKNQIITQQAVAEDR